MFVPSNKCTLCSITRNHLNFSDISLIGGSFVCSGCIITKKLNNVTRFESLVRENFFATVTTEYSAYLLGVMFGNTEFSVDKFMSLTYDESQLIKNNCENIHRDNLEVTLPKELWIHFVRGVVESTRVVSAEQECLIVVKPDSVRKFVSNVSSVPNRVDNLEKIIVWENTNALDFLYELYQNFSVFNAGLYNTFLASDCVFKPAKSLATFKWCKTLPDAPAPQKSRFTDTGFDLHLVKLSKIVDNVYYYDTGIKVQPAYGYYFDLVGRSSIAKSGYTLANNIGIIDCSYRGSIIVALVKTSSQAKKLRLPSRLVQIIPRQLILMEPEEVVSDELLSSQRNTGGFGSTNTKT